MGCRMFLKMHFLYSHLELLPENLKAVSDKRFYQNIEAMEERYQGVWNEDMIDVLP